MITPARVLEAVQMRAEGQMLEAIAATFGVGRSLVFGGLDRLDDDATGTAAVAPRSGADRVREIGL